MSGYEGETHRLQPPCPLCQGMTFTWGRINTQTVTTFIPDDASGLEKFMGLGDALAARMCEACGNVQFFRRDRVQI